jgi:hypothetical protein
MGQVTVCLVITHTLPYHTSPSLKNNYLINNKSSRREPSIDIKYSWWRLRRQPSQVCWVDLRNNNGVIMEFVHGIFDHQMAEGGGAQGNLVPHVIEL